ncbi:DMT family transporter [Agromyces aurantiacus]|uniref:DMT family transporter n=1 Tax=Agromyces aurantiacus TaxID=165814 RepID=A0ABV9QZD1_9MICO|nr:DMT family transporter [Agromyces aurantiacus]MBM7505532.1 transporter family-2 protein [Agromyces aurantiacus]
MTSTPAPGPADVAAPSIPSTPTSLGDHHPHHHAERSRVPMWAAVALTVVSGALVAVQSRINGQLATRLDDFAVAALISFGSGLLILLAVLAAWPAGRRGVGRLRAALRERRLARWMLLGGVAGAWFVATQGIAAGVLGVALFTVAIVAGQTLGGVVFDAIGIGPGGRRPLTVPRVAGAVLALAAIGWAVSAQVAAAVPVLLMVLPFSAGFAVSWQQAMNGRVRTAASSALAATLVNFAVGTTVLVVVLLVHAASVGWPTAMPAEPWLYAGGAVGCVFIAMQAALVRRVGVLVLALGIVAGQLAAALALDLLLPTSGHGVGLATIGGTVLALVAVALSSARRPARHTAPPAPVSPAS